MPAEWEALYARASTRSSTVVRECAEAVIRLHDRLGALERGHTGALWPGTGVLRSGTQVACGRGRPPGVRGSPQHADVRVGPDLEAKAPGTHDSRPNQKP